MLNNETFVVNVCKCTCINNFHHLSLLPRVKMVKIIVQPLLRLVNCYAEKQTIECSLVKLGYSYCISS